MDAARDLAAALAEVERILKEARAYDVHRTYPYPWCLLHRCPVHAPRRGNFPRR